MDGKKSNSDSLELHLGSAGRQATGPDGRDWPAHPSAQPGATTHWQESLPWRAEHYLGAPGTGQSVWVTSTFPKDFSSIQVTLL